MWIEGEIPTINKMDLEEIMGEGSGQLEVALQLFVIILRQKLLSLTNKI
jgi:hypothetical protein